METSFFTKKSGFTIVELLIVVVVIGILAAITIVAYAGVTNQAVSNGLKSELSTAAKKVEAAKILSASNQYPSSLESAGILSKEGVQQTYRLASGGFCIGYKNGARSYQIKASQSPVEGFCEGNVTTYAGSGVEGNADGPVASASFKFPIALAVDTSNTLYVADSQNFRIRKITTNGQVSTLAGTVNGGPFTNTVGVAVDAQQNAYVSSGHRIYKVTPAGVATVFVGSNGSGSVDGTGGAARFTNPRGLAVAPNQDIYVVDYDNHRIRKVSPTGVVETVSGGARGYVDGPIATAQFRFPTAIAVAADGTLFVVDMGNNVIRKISTSGIVSTVAGSATAGNIDGVGSAARFSGPEGIAIDSIGNLYVTDTINCSVRLVTQAGVVSTIAGGGCDGPVNGVGLTARFNDPAGIIVDGNGAVYVSDWGNQVIRRIE